MLNSSYFIFGVVFGLLINGFMTFIDYLDMKIKSGKKKGVDNGKNKE